MVYIYNGILLHLKEELSLAIWDNMDGTEGHNAKWNKSEKDKYCMISLIRWNLKKKKNQAHKYREQIGACMR